MSSQPSCKSGIQVSPNADKENAISQAPHIVGQQSSTLKSRKRTYSSAIKICMHFLVNKSYCGCFSVR
ncbi:hypothetical protein T11_13993 [Trichinella zimbabwensis]|uniref:Uncharacterized protein n=1 Tax=Trichinella zimbabwensis TaxID=268475 RepID=A0A0V1GCV5_9BILA|nr:hypothetical protein T11_13993 [Trichinella zimbabwensis]